MSIAVSRHSSLDSWGILFRAGNSATGIFGVFLGAVLAIKAIPEGEIALITSLHAFSVFSFMCSWNALNDYLDVDIDRVNRPERPIPSGKITLLQAKTAIIISLTLSFLSLAIAGVVANDTDGGLEGWMPALAIWAIALLLLVNYESSSPISLGLKDRGLPGNIAISLSVGMVVLLGAAGVFEPYNHRAWTAFTIGFLFNLAREIVKDVEDMKGDKGRETFAMRAGPERARLIAWLILIVTLTAILFPFAWGIFPKPHLVLVIPSVVILLMVKPKLFGCEDRTAQMMIKRSMQLCLVAFLVSSLIH